MADTFKALVLRQEGDKVRNAIEELQIGDLPEGDVLVAVEYSSLNYKDAMAVTGAGKIVREYPMVPGIDLAGTVLESKSPFYKAGDKVVLTGWSVGERYWGGYTQRARVNSNWLVPLPEGLDTHHAMAIGTAGFTAMLCVMTLEEAGIKPGSGAILVTGAAGQLGSTLVAHLASRAHDVIGCTRADLDVTRHADVLRVAADVRPDAIVNCAGYNDVDGAEDAAATALEVNAFAVRSLARAARESGVAVRHAGKRLADMRLHGSTPNLGGLLSLDIEAGRFFTDTEVSGHDMSGRREQVFAIGPGGLWSITPKLHMFFNTYFESHVRNRPQGFRSTIRFVYKY